MESNILFTIVNLGILAFTAWLSFRRVPFQNTSDAAAAVQKFQEATVSIQAEMRKAREEMKMSKERIDYLEGVLERAHLTVTLGIEIGKRPEVLEYKWLTPEESQTK